MASPPLTPEKGDNVIAGRPTAADDETTSLTPSATAAEAAGQRPTRRDVVAEWRVATTERMHVIEFEHGTTSGKRVLWVDGKELIRRDWMFKLVGDDPFQLTDTVRCLLRVCPAPGMKFTYSLYVDGKPFEQYRDHRARALKTWEYRAVDGTGDGDEGRLYRIVLEKDTLTLFINGVQRDEQAEFAEEGGTDTNIALDGHTFCVTARSRSAPTARNGLAYRAYVDGEEIEECVEK